MEVQNTREVASIKTLDVEMSEDELDVYEKCLSYVLQHCAPDDIESISGATPDELKAIHHQIDTILKKHTGLR